VHTLLVPTLIAAFSEWDYSDYPQGLDMYNDDWGPNYYSVFNTLGLSPKKQNFGGPNLAVGYQHDKLTAHDGKLYPVSFRDQSSTCFRRQHRQSPQKPSSSSSSTSTKAL
jgi:hypothetical protein